MRILFLAPLLALTACNAVAPEPANEIAAPASPAAVPIASSADILGHWDLVSFEGDEPQWRMQGTTAAAFAHFREDGVSLRFECNYSGADGKVVEGRWVSRPGDRIMTLMGCGQQIEARDSRLFAFFDRNPTAERLADGRLRFVAGDTVLLLERPEQRRLAYRLPADRIEGKWRLEFLTRYEPQGGYSGIGMQDVPGRLVIEGNRAFYNRCPQYGITFTYSDDGRLTKTGGTLPANPVCPGLTTTEDYGEMPRTAQVLDLLHDNPWLERVGDEAVILSNGKLAVQMTQAPCEMVSQSDDHQTTTVQDCASPE